MRVEGASDSVHRQSWVMTAVKGISRFFPHFRAPPGCPGVERQFFEPSMTKSCGGPATVSWWRSLVPVRFAPDGEARSRPGVTVAGGPTPLYRAMRRSLLHQSRACLCVVWCPGGVCVVRGGWVVQKILRRTFSLSRAAPGSPKVGSRMVLVLGRWVGTFF